MALKPPDSKSDKFTVNTNNNRPFSEPPPYPGTTSRSAYSHVSHSTLTKFNSGRSDAKLGVVPNGAHSAIDQQRKSYVPLGEIRRNIPSQTRPQGGQSQQVPLPQNPATASSYQPLPTFSQQGSQGPSRTPILKDEADDDLSFQMTEDELLMLSVPVLARKLVEAQNRITTQASEIKGTIKYFLLLHYPLQHVFSRSKILLPTSPRRQSGAEGFVLFSG